ncbi:MULTISPECIES: filamentous hemagglutinin N-terminal domain-containing protein [Aerosakkonema]|uniref:filamentous hemagglutinin N-terminal domain-containing protein n=1 Tax=Aerosakkonema TaxID=1246629 RepID=UPI0035B9C209
MKSCSLRFWSALGSASAYLLVATTATAQIVPDAAGQSNSTVTQQGNTSIIEGGTRNGGNLLHSFQEFSVPTGGTVVFNNAVDIQNIFARVTGSSVSNIDGLIQVNGTAHLFLHNSNGVIFGPNAQLNVGGSFVLTTNKEVNFADGTNFSASNSQTAPLLTVNIPGGLHLAGTDIGGNSNFTLPFSVGTVSSLSFAVPLLGPPPPPPGEQFNGKAPPPLNISSLFRARRAQFADVVKLFANQPCSRSSLASTFYVTGRGGLPPSPTDALTDEAVWVDLRDRSIMSGIGGSRKNSSPTTQHATPSTELVEATGWSIAPDGKVVLSANLTDVTPSSSSCQAFLPLSHSPTP